MRSYKYVIIGGGLAGQRAGDGIRKVDTEGTVALVTREHQAAAAQKARREKKEGAENKASKDRNP